MIVVQIFTPSNSRSPLREFNVDYFHKDCSKGILTVSCMDSAQCAEYKYNFCNVVYYQSGWVKIEVGLDDN